MLAVGAIVYLAGGLYPVDRLLAMPTRHEWPPLPSQS